MRIIKRRLCGFTVTELLVVMIISGSIFLAVSEGLSMFLRYSSSAAAGIGNNSRFFEAYCRLDDIVASADSIRSSGHGTWDLYRSGELRYALEEKDSLLVIQAGNLSDTLPVKISGLQLVCGSVGYGTADTLRLELISSKSRQLPLTLHTMGPLRGEDAVNMMEKEKKYAYE